MAHTIFHSTRVPLTLWFYAMLHFANSASGVNSRFLLRHLGVSNVAALRICRRIRQHLAMIDKNRLMGGTRNVVNVRLVTHRRVRRREKGKKRSARIFLIADEAHANSTVMLSPLRHDLIKVIRDKCQPGVKVITTCYDTSRVLSHYGTRLQKAEFSPTYFIDRPEIDDVLTGFLSYFREPVFLQYKGVDRRNLWMYLKEFEFRYNRRNASETIFDDMISQFPILGKKEILELESWNSRCSSSRLTGLT